ncbi:hypothetical protein WICMUC_002102 [Wickerhamomyces mucosus]|uniref:Uncharacterized protein n=1 Tax=Wickerhamomyces mucosus TaxID=1378264 RepID=A0A9P8TEV9_9ASCO|nr:hypothetical protein WICMUC_002102 [Wickerhamomyces mucosus]
MSFSNLQTHKERPLFSTLDINSKDFKRATKPEDPSQNIASIGTFLNNENMVSNHLGGPNLEYEKSELTLDSPNTSDRPFNFQRIDSSVSFNDGASIFSRNSSLENSSYYRNTFSSKIKANYDKLVNLLPSFIILLPALIKILQPKIVQIWLLKTSGTGMNLAQQLKYYENNLKLSNLTVEFFSILIICWIIKFLLDWPWKWYLQINNIKIKYINFNLLHYEEKIKEKIRSNLKVLNWQYFLSLSLCIIAPFLCGLLLLFSRNYIIIIDNHENSVIFSDLNIGLFVSCGLVRIIIQLSENVQSSTASIDINMEKIINDSFQNTILKKKEELSNFFEINHNQELLINLDSKLGSLESNINDLNSKFLKFEKKITQDQKNIPSNNNAIHDSILLKQFKLLEKEIYQFSRDLSLITQDMDYKYNQLKKLILAKSSTPSVSIPTITTTKTTATTSNPTSTISKDAAATAATRTAETTTIPTTTKSPSTVIEKEENNESLHGVPLSKTPYLKREKSFITIPITSNVRSSDNSTLYSKFDIINQFIPFELFISDNNEHEYLLNELTSLDSLSVLNLSSRPIFGYIIRTPFVILALIWRIIMFIPNTVWKIGYFLMIQMVDLLIRFNTLETRESNISLEAN